MVRLPSPAIGRPAELQSCGIQQAACVLLSLISCDMPRLYRRSCGQHTATSQRPESNKTNTRAAGLNASITSIQTYKVAILGNSAESVEAELCTHQQLLIPAGRLRFLWRAVWSGRQHPIKARPDPTATTNRLPWIGHDRWMSGPSRETPRTHQHCCAGPSAWRAAWAEGGRDLPQDPLRPSADFWRWAARSAS